VSGGRLIFLSARGFCFCQVLSDDRHAEKTCEFILREGLDDSWRGLLRMGTEFSDDRKEGYSPRAGRIAPIPVPMHSRPPSDLLQTEKTNFNVHECAVVRSRPDRDRDEIGASDFYGANQLPLIRRGERENCGSTAADQIASGSNSSSILPLLSANESR